MTAYVHAQAFAYAPGDVAVVVRDEGTFATLRIGDLSVYMMGTPAEQAAILRAIAAGCRIAADEMVPEPMDGVGTGVVALPLGVAL